MSPRLTRLLSFLGAIALLLTAGPGARTASADPAIPAGGIVRPDLHPGDLASDGYAAAMVPPPGNSVWSSNLAIDGSSQELGVQTLTDGTVVVYSYGDDSFSDGGLAGSPAACNDSKYNYLGGGSSPSFTWQSRFDWYFKADSVPGDVNTDNARQAVRNATSHITGADNPCGLTDNVTATALFQADTVRGTNISTGDPPACETNDFYSVTMYGDLSDTWLSATCTWVSGSAAVESDTKLNGADYYWYAVLSPSCTNRWSTESVATHERGFTFGLGRVSEATHGNLTMSTKINGVCQDAERSLGLGDVRGLESMY
jgi:hypothetical protein